MTKKCGFRRRKAARGNEKKACSDTYKGEKISGNFLIADKYGRVVLLRKKSAFLFSNAALIRYQCVLRLKKLYSARVRFYFFAMASLRLSVSQTE